MRSIIEFFLDRPEWLTPTLVALEITLLCAASLVVARMNRNDASVRYGIGVATLGLVWLSLPITLLVQAAGWTSWAYTEKVISGPVYEFAGIPLAEPAHTINWFLVVWLLGSALGGARILHGAIRVWDLKRKAFPLTNAIYVTDEISGPVVVGPIQPAILVPRKVLAGLSEDEFADVLAHEFAHVSKKHLYVAIFQRITAAILWPHPLVHLLNRAIVDAREEICDNVVLKSADPVRYARVLLRVAECRQDRPHVASALGLFGPKTQLEKRVKSLLNPNRRITTEMNTRKLAFAALALTMAVGAIGAARINMEIVPAGAATSVPKVQETKAIAAQGKALTERKVALEKAERLIEVPVTLTIQDRKGAKIALERAVRERSKAVKLKLKLVKGQAVTLSKVAPEIVIVQGQAAPLVPAKPGAPSAAGSAQAAPKASVTLTVAQGSPASQSAPALAAPKAIAGSAAKDPVKVLTPAQASGTIVTTEGKPARVFITTGGVTTAKSSDVVIVGSTKATTTDRSRFIRLDSVKSGDVVFTTQAAPAKGKTIEYRIVTADGKPAKVQTIKGEKLEYRIATDPVKASGSAPSSKPAYIVTSGNVVVTGDSVKTTASTPAVYRVALPQAKTTWKTTADPQFKSYIWTRVDGKSKYVALKGGTHYYKIDSSKGVWKVVTGDKKGTLWRVLPDGKSISKPAAKGSTLGKVVPDKKSGSKKG
jgi:hypothetical protein